MSTFPASSQLVYQAAIDGVFEEVKRLVAMGADLNVSAPEGDPLLEVITCDLLRGEQPSPFYLEMLRLLLQLGADPNLVGPDETSALTYAMWSMDSQLLEIFLMAGADPNLPALCHSSGTFYDSAEFDYRCEVWLKQDFMGGSIYPPDEPTEADMLSEDAWLSFLDRQAIKYGVRRPDHLFLLRRYGARTGQEQSYTSGHP